MVSSLTCAFYSPFVFYHTDKPCSSLASGLLGETHTNTQKNTLLYLPTATKQDMEKAPPTCAQFAVADALDIKPEQALVQLQVTYHDLVREYKKKDESIEFLGSLEKNHYHHNVCCEVLRRNGFEMKVIKHEDYDVAIQTSPGLVFVYGKLNIDGFQPYTTKLNGKSINQWLDPDCKMADFFGLEPIVGEENHDYHVVVIKNSRLHCLNLVNASDQLFTMAAKNCLPMTKSTDGQCRIQKKNPMAYLATISRMFQIEKSVETLPAPSVSTPVAIPERPKKRQCVDQPHGPAVQGPTVATRSVEDQDDSSAARQPAHKKACMPVLMKTRKPSPPASKPMVGGKPLYGAALFNNDGHDGPAKTKARSYSASKLCALSNELKGDDWQEFSEFKPDKEFVDELEAFKQKLSNHLSQDMLKPVRFQGLDGHVIDGPTELTYDVSSGDLMMATLSIGEFWPTLDKDMEELYELAGKLVPKQNRSKNRERTEWMHSFGVKQMGMGANDLPVLLKFKKEGSKIYEQFKNKASMFYCKQQMLEHLVAPENSETRLTMKDKKVKDSCCAIPGVEKFLWALACSITREYYPDLHMDTPNVGTLECIIFSSSDQAVLVGKCGDVEKIIPLDKPMLILLDSKQVEHAAMCSEEAARKALEEAKKKI